MSSFDHLCCKVNNFFNQKNNKFFLINFFISNDRCYNFNDSCIVEL